MCKDCKKCILSDDFIDLSTEGVKNLNNIISNLTDPVSVKINFVDGTICAGIIKFNKNNEIVITDGEGEDYLCNILEFITYIEVI